MSGVASLSLDMLPSVGDTLPLVKGMLLRLPWSWVGRLERPIVLGLASAGIVRLRWDGFEAGQLSSREELALVDGEGRRGRVLVDRWLALNVVAATLGFAPPRALRRLGAGERGILAGHLAALLTFAGGRVVVDLAADAGERQGSARVVGLAFRAEAAGAEGPIRVEVPAVWLSASGWPSAGFGAVAKVAARLETTARVEIADTLLSRGAVSCGKVGDVVIFDGYPFPADAGGGAAFPVRVRIGEHEAEGESRADGTIVLLGAFRQAGKRQQPAAAPGVADRLPVVKDAVTMAGASEDNDSKLAVLAGAPVEVVAEVGRVTLRGDEVLALERGSVLAFGRRVAEVDLLVGGRSWARGELVNVDGELGVRICELIRS